MTNKKKLPLKWAILTAAVVLSAPIITFFTVLGTGGPLAFALVFSLVSLIAVPLFLGILTVLVAFSLSSISELFDVEPPKWTDKVAEMLNS